MSVGKILRKILKKWLKKDSETGVIEPTEYELYEENEEPLATGHLNSEPCLQDCMFCIERDGTCGGDLNRNVHISDEMGFSNDSAGYRKCRLDDWDCGLSDTSYSSSCPLHSLNHFMDDSLDFSFDSACHSSQSPVPLCVCEACYIFVSSHLSLHLPSTPSASPRTVAADTAGQPLCDSETRYWSHQCPTGPDLSKASSKTGRSGMIGREVEPTDCNKDSSISVTSNRRFHSVTSPKSPGCSVERLPKTSSSSGHVNLPPSVHRSLDGEEGFVEGQRRLLSTSRWEDVAHKPFRPPPNKTICHVAK